MGIADRRNDLIYTPEPKQCVGNTLVIPDEPMSARRQRNVEAMTIGADGERWRRAARIFHLAPAVAT